MYGVTIEELIQKMNLVNKTPELDTEKIVVAHPDVNRPALQLTGFFEHFDRERVQIIGYVESAYLERLDEEKRREVYEKLISCNIPCLIYSRGMEPEPVVLELCSHYGVPCMVSHQTTSDLMAEVIRWLKVKLAPVKMCIRDRCSIVSSNSLIAVYCRISRIKVRMSLSCSCSNAAVSFIKRCSERIPFALSV